MYECEKDRQGGRDSHQREEIVGSASSFIAALMSPGTHRLETAVLFSPRPCQQILHSYWHTETHVHSEQITTYIVQYGCTHILYCMCVYCTHSTLIWSVEFIKLKANFPRNIEVESSSPFWKAVKLLQSVLSDKLAHTQRVGLSRPRLSASRQTQQTSVFWSKARQLLLHHYNLPRL